MRWIPHAWAVTTGFVAYVAAEHDKPFLAACFVYYGLVTMWSEYVHAIRESRKP